MAFVDNGHTYIGNLSTFITGDSYGTRIHKSPRNSCSPSNIYDHIVKVGNTVYIPRQVSRYLDGKTTHVGDPEAQIRETWANLEIEIKAVGVYHNK